MNFSNFLKMASPVAYVGFWVWFLILLIFDDLSEREIAGWLTFNIMPWGTIVSYIGAYALAFIGL